MSYVYKTNSVALEVQEWDVYNIKPVPLFFINGTSYALA